MKQKKYLEDNQHELQKRRSFDYRKLLFNISIIYFCKIVERAVINNSQNMFLRNASRESSLVDFVQFNCKMVDSKHVVCLLFDLICSQVLSTLSNAVLLSKN